MDRNQKTETVSWVTDVFEKNAVVLVVGNAGLNVSEMSDLRGQLREAGASMKVVKNRLAKIAIAGTPAEPISQYFKGPTAIAYAEDPVAPAKVIEKYAKANDKLQILGGAMGSEIMDEAGVKALASMPSREEIIASIVLQIGAPAANIAGAIAAPAANIASILKTIEEKEAA